MIDCWDGCSFYDGDNDNYHIHEYDYYQNINKKPFIKNPNYYDGWKKFEQIIERDTCYSILIKDIWMNIPKKIVRQVKDNQMLVHLNTFDKIETNAIEKYLEL